MSVMDKEDEKEFPKDFVRSLGQNNYLGIPFSKDVEVSMAKFFSTESAWNIIDQCLQILGGIGYTDYYPVERFLRDVRVAKIYTGTNEMMRELTQRAIYEELLSDKPSSAWKLWKGTKNLV